MAKPKQDRKKQKRKAKVKQLKSVKKRAADRDRGDYYLFLAEDYMESGNPEKALVNILKAEKLLPPDEYLFRTMAHIAQKANDPGVETRAMEGLYKLEVLPGEFIPSLILRLHDAGQFKKCLEITEAFLALLPALKLKNKRMLKKELLEIVDRCHFELSLKQFINDPRNITAVKKEIRSAAGPEKKTATAKKGLKPVKESRPAGKGGEAGTIRKPDRVLEIPVDYRVDSGSFYKALARPEPVSHPLYELALESHGIRLQESFEILVCLSSLSQVRSFWYQEETVKKVLKRFRGRALLSDEVGLGKTIEALMVLSEYRKRGMVKSGLILTPTPLVSQWKDEMRSKFGIEIPSTDDPGFKSGDRRFWEEPFVLASINQAKSKKNFDLVTARQYDLLIVDEAHHLKNRTTLNWKLVNSIQKKFILLLTATPVENNLMELYNLITLLKPGQLETAGSFRERFMTRGDPTDPRNRALLKELLGEVMIRNTRALAGINIPPRYARTVRVEPSNHERNFYGRLESLILAMNRDSKGGGQLVVKNLLAQAGSSPRAVELSLINILKKDAYPVHLHDELTAVKTLCRTTVDTSKNKALLKVIQSSGEKIIIFVKYKGTVEHLAEFLEWNDISFSLFHGSLDNTEKERAIEAFREKHQVLVTTEIGGEGRNLQFCSRMVNYDLPWNPMKIEQRIGRIHRIGQEREVEIFNLCAKDSIEDHILDILDRKINMFEMVIGEIDMILGRIRGDKEFGDLVYDLWVNSESGTERKKQFNNLGEKLKRAKTGYEKTKELDDTLFGDSYEL